MFPVWVGGIGAVAMCGSGVWGLSALPGSVVGPGLWIVAVILVVAGIVSIVRGQLLWGIVLITVGLLVGPGGVSIFEPN
jgi:hypothetical protein